MEGLNITRATQLAAKLIITREMGRRVYTRSQFIRVPSSSILRLVLIQRGERKRVVLQYGCGTREMQMASDPLLIRESH